MPEHYEPTRERLFQNQDRTYKYDFNILTIEQAELAREVGEFKYNQMQSEPESFRQIVRSRGAEWLSIVASYLLREVKNGEVQPFNKDKAESEVEAFVKNLPVSELNRLKECVEDFFSAIEKKQLVLAIWRGEKRRSGLEILLPILQKTMQGNLKQDA